MIATTSTKIALPISNWTPVVTNAFDGSGHLGQPVTVNPTLSRSFYLLQVHRHKPAWLWNQKQSRPAEQRGASQLNAVCNTNLPVDNNVKSG
jgi:hypothetical protein